jgi:hypothetical protein
MKSKFVAGALAGALIFAVCASPSQALTFQFSFTGIGGTVTGEIDGLVDNDTSSATHLVINSYPALLDVGVAAPFDAVATADGIFYNSFAVAGGVIQTYLFAANHAFQWGGTGGWQLCFSYNQQCQALAYLSDGTNTVSGSQVTFSQVAATPLPAALPLFATGLGALGLLRWRRRRKNAAAIAA